jgi:pilus assembly protein FimV
MQHRCRRRSARRGGRACGRLQRLPQQAGRPGGQRTPVKAPEAARAPAARSPPRSRNARPPPTSPRTSCACRRRRPAPPARATAWRPKTRSPSRSELDEAQQRVKELEKNVNDLEKLMVVEEQGRRGRPSSIGRRRRRPVRRGPAPARTSRPEAQARPSSRLPPKRRAQPVRLPHGQPDPYVGLAAAALLLGGRHHRLSAARRRFKACRRNRRSWACRHAGALAVRRTGGQSIDTNNSVFNSSFAPSASQLDTNEVDPVAEADVYIAYGRDAQAEEILKEALRTHPERYPVRLKLLEIYAAPQGPARLRNPGRPSCTA